MLVFVSVSLQSTKMTRIGSVTILYGMLTLKSITLPLHTSAFRSLFLYQHSTYKEGDSQPGRITDKQKNSLDPGSLGRGQH